jgi:hypothetical protein
VPMQTMNYTELFRNMSLDVCYWITKDTHLLKKTDIVEIFSVTPQSLGLNASESRDLEMRINAEVSMIFEGFNESVNIEIPAEAKKAPLFPIGIMVSTEAAPVVNETMTTSENGTAQVAATA